jgi:hypothetical protein
MAPAVKDTTISQGPTRPSRPKPAPKGWTWKARVNNSPVVQLSTT